MTNKNSNDTRENEVGGVCVMTNKNSNDTRENEVGGVCDDK